MSQRNAFILKAAVLLYRAGIATYMIGVRLAAQFNTKAALWFNGRKQQWPAIKALNEETPRIWIHCASLGEFEQGRPVIERIKQLYPHIPIILTFYSPSGYEVRKHYPLVDHVFYLPIDTPDNAAFFIKKINPCLAIFIKYEFWYFHLTALKARQVPTLLISALFRQEQAFFKWYGTFFRTMLSCFTWIFVQDKTSSDLLAQYYYSNTRISGDTRIDNVLHRAATPVSLPLIEAFIGHSSTMIAGSTWPVDEKMLFDFLKTGQFSDWKVIIVPHDIHESHLIQIEKMAVNLPVVRVSALTSASIDTVQVLLVDNIGSLFDLYHLADIAYIGGGFGKSIHNTLEPAAFGLPVIFGPRYKKFEEAKAFVKSGGGICVHSADELTAALNTLKDPVQRKQASLAIQQWMQENKGGTSVIMQYIQTLLP